MAMISREAFVECVRNTPLISIDLCVFNEKNEVLLGLRTNRPARGTWFVPGGRVMKDEPRAKALRRLVRKELGVDLDAELAAGSVQFSYRGTYDHFYPDNFSGTDFTTHYVVLGVGLRFNRTLGSLPADEHSTYRWASEDELMKDEQVHPNTKGHFGWGPTEVFGVAQ